MTALRDLRPRIGDPGTFGEQALAFLCPRCRKHEILIEIWNGKSGEVEKTVAGQVVRRKVWHAEQGPNRDWETLTVTPSINRDGLGDKCGGWHGFITNGEVA